MTPQLVALLVRWCQDARYRDSSDWELLERYLTARDESAFAALVGRHGPAVFALCRSLVRCPDRADEAFQQTFVDLLRWRRSLPGPSVRPWLLRVAGQRCRRLLAREGRRRTLLERLAARAPAAGEPADRAAEREEVQRLVAAAVAALPPRYGLPVLLHDLHGRPLPEVARDLGRSERTVRKQLERGRRKLRDRLRPHFGDPGPTAAAALVAVADGRAEAVPPALVAATVRAAVHAAARRTWAALAAAAAGWLGSRRWLTAGVAAVLLAVGEGVWSTGERPNGRRRRPARRPPPSRSMVSATCGCCASASYRRSWPRRTAC